MFLFLMIALCLVILFLIPQRINKANESSSKKALLFGKKRGYPVINGDCFIELLKARQETGAFPDCVSEHDLPFLETIGRDIANMLIVRSDFRQTVFGRLYHFPKKTVYILCPSQKMGIAYHIGYPSTSTFDSKQETSCIKTLGERTKSNDFYIVYFHNGGFLDVE